MEANDGDDPETYSGERGRAVAGIEVLLRVLKKAVDCFEGDDLETIVILLTVGAASVGRHLKDPEFLASLGTAPLPDEYHRPTTARSIAESTGLPRETVRRRLKTLVDQGRLQRDANGFRTLSGILTRNRNLEFVRFLVAELNGAPQKLARF